MNNQISRRLVLSTLVQITGRTVCRGTRRSPRSESRRLSAFWVKSLPDTSNVCSAPNLGGGTTGCQSVAVQTAGHHAQSHARTRFTCGVAVQDPRHDHHFVRLGALARQHDTGCKDVDEAVADDCLLPDGGTQSHRHLWNTVLRATRLPPSTHLPSLPETNLTLRAPKTPPRAYMETIRDQIMVTVCGGGCSAYLWNQLLLMKLCMNCNKTVKPGDVKKNKKN